MDSLLRWVRLFIVGLLLCALSGCFPGQPPLANQPPVASFTYWQGESALTIVYDGSSSYDPEGSAIWFYWEFGCGRTATGQAVVSHTYETVGVYRVTLTVRDNQGAIGVAYRDITVQGGGGGGGGGDPCAGVSGYTPVHYQWRYQLLNRTLSHHIPNYLICRAQHAGVPRWGPFPHTGLSQLVNWPEDDQLLRELAAAINDGLTDYYEVATNTLHFVQGLMPYTDDVGDYWQLPVETLRLKSGDCEDGAILYVALLRSLGYPVFFGVYPGHAFAFVEVAKAWVDLVQGRPNKCRDLYGAWTIAIYQGRYYAMAETTIDPILKTLGYWGLGCGTIPQSAWDSGNVRIFSTDTGLDVTADFAILTLPCSCERPDTP